MHLNKKKLLLTLFPSFLLYIASASAEIRVFKRNPSASSAASRSAASVGSVMTVYTPTLTEDMEEAEKKSPCVVDSVDVTVSPSTHRLIAVNLDCRLKDRNPFSILAARIEMSA